MNKTKAPHRCFDGFLFKFLIILVPGSPVRLSLYIAAVYQLQFKKEHVFCIPCTLTACREMKMLLDG
jgi:hypothetical protein